MQILSLCAHLQIRTSGAMKRCPTSDEGRACSLQECSGLRLCLSSMPLGMAVLDQWLFALAACENHPGAFTHCGCPACAPRSSDYIHPVQRMRLKKHGGSATDFGSLVPKPPTCLLPALSFLPPNSSRPPPNQRAGCRAEHGGRRRPGFLTPRPHGLQDLGESICSSLSRLPLPHL